MTGLRSRLARLGRLVRKELSECLRDRRTVLTLVLMPLLLYPVLALAFQQVLLANKADRETSYPIAFRSEEELFALVQYWKRGADVLAGRPPAMRPVPVTPELFAELRLRAEFDDEPARLVKLRRVEAAVCLDPPGVFAINPRFPSLVNATITHRDDSYTSRDAAKHFERLTAAANALIVSEWLQLAGQRQRGDPVRVRSEVVADESGKNLSLLPVLVPLVLVLMTMTGAVYPAIDLTAGERERGTLEILVAAPIPRLSVLLAKYAAVFVVAMLTAVVNLGTMALTLSATGIASALFGVGLTFAALVQILGLMILFAAFFSAVLLCLTSFARSFKEAQAYLIPLMLVCLTPGILAVTADLSLDGFLSVVPLINVVLLARGILDGTASGTAAIAVVVSTLLYAAAALAVAARVFGAEAVLSSETAGWSDLFARPPKPRPYPELSGAMLCLALLFPVYFFVNSGAAQLAGLSLGSKLALTVFLNVALFVGFPAVALRTGNVPFTKGFRLASPGVFALAAAVLIGASAWPFVQEIILWLRESGVTTLREDNLKRIRELLEAWRTVGPVPIVLAMAVVPAIVEELFFRGYLFSALYGDGKSPARAVVGSAVCFAVFHLLVDGAMMFERVPASLLMGLLLGALALRSGSVVPGIVLHAIHNGVIILLGYYQDEVTASGWLPGDGKHLPPVALAAAGGLLVVGLAVLAFLTKPRRAT